MKNPSRSIMGLPSSDETIKKGLGGGTRHILYVDDEPDLLLSLGELLRYRGFKVTISASGDEAIQNFKSNEFDLLLTDIKMPNMGGYELYRELRVLDPRIKVCFFTGHNEYVEQFRTQFPSMDEKCFVTKPISPRQLADRITAILDSPKNQHDARPSHD